MKFITRIQEAIIAGVKHSLNILERDDVLQGLGPSDCKKNNHGCPWDGYCLKASIAVCSDFEVEFP